MMRICINKIIAVLITILCMGSISLHAQQFKGIAKVECPSEVIANEAFNYSVEIQPDSIINVAQLLPQFETLKVMWGPQISQNSLLTIRSGERIKTYSQKFVYVLSADVGVHKIPAFQIKDSAGNYYDVPETTIVSKEINVGPATDHTNTSKVKNIGSTVDSTLLVLSLDKSSVNIGEPVLLTAKLATCENLGSLNNLKCEFDYCYAEQIVNTEPIDWKVEVINGMKYNTTPLLKYRLIPLQSGEITLGQIELQLTIKKPYTSKNLFDAFFNDNIEIKKTVQSDNVVLKVSKDNAEKREKVVKKYTGDNLLVAFDISGSMRCYDFDGTRLEVAKRIASNIKCHYPQTHILPFASKFGNTIYDIDDINDLDSVNLEKEDGTAFYDIGLFALYNHYRGLSYRDIVIITDGNDNASHISRRTFADLMAEYGVRVHIVNINSNQERVEVEDNDSRISNVSKVEVNNIIANATVLNQLTKSTGGVYIEVRCLSDVEKAVAYVVNRIKTESKSRKPSTQYNIGEDILNTIATDYYNNNRLR